MDFICSKYEFKWLFETFKNICEEREAATNILNVAKNYFHSSTVYFNLATVNNVRTYVGNIKKNSARERGDKHQKKQVRIIGKPEMNSKKRESAQRSDEKFI